MMTNLNDPVMVALIALAGAILGAVLQSFLTRNFERSKFIRDHRRLAYQKFIAALGEISQNHPSSDEHSRARSSVVDARCQIALFGSKRVVMLLARVFESSAAFDSPLDQHRLYEALLAMRQDSLGAQHDGIKTDLFALVWATGNGDLK